MFRHKGKSRTFLHNLRLASILSFIAGIVNITGVLSVKTLTTNVTGHFAFFAEEIVNENFAHAFAFLFYILFFLLGAFVSNLIIEILLRIKPLISHVVPMTIEILILILIGIFGQQGTLTYFDSQLVACFLLFAMGIQNSLVTKVSQSVVRTTHLTGLFTDLGIEISQLIFYRKTIEFKKLTRSIYLKLFIILFFFLGCVLGGFVFKWYQLGTLFIAAICLIVGLMYDMIRFRLYNLKRRLFSR